jgi:hypothetical protein
VADATGATADIALDSPFAVPALIQANGTPANNQASVSSSLSTVTAGHLLIATLDTVPMPNLVSITDSVGSTYQVIGPFDGTVQRTYIMFTTLATSGTVNVSAAVDTAPTNITLRLTEFSGIDASPLDISGSSGGNVNVPGTTSGPTLMTSRGGELIM